MKKAGYIWKLGNIQAVNKRQLVILSEAKVLNLGVFRAFSRSED
jgi:hypothetical protein